MGAAELPVEGTKVCKGCGEEKGLTEFYRVRRDKDAWMPRCKPCHNQTNEEQRKKRGATRKRYPRSVNPKTCVQCNETKPASDFYSATTSSDGLYSRCKRCSYLRLRAYKERNREKMMAHSGSLQRLRKDTGVSRNEVGTWIKKRAVSPCEICGRSAAEGALMQIDHDHETGKIRGILCGRCNHVLGLANDDVRLLEAAISYVLSHRQIANVG